MGRGVIEYMESPRRKALEKQYRESVARKVEDKLEKKLDTMDKKLDAIDHWLTVILKHQMRLVEVLVRITNDKEGKV